MAQLGGVHLACEQASNVLTKVLEWGRLMSYLEQSTRYIAYDSRIGGRYRFYRDPAVLSSRFGTRYVGDMDRLFDTYSLLLTKVTDHVRATVERDPSDSDFVFRQATRAKALDAVRGVLPAASLSNVGHLRQRSRRSKSLLLRMRAHPLPEARQYADLMLHELRKVIPSFLRRVDIADRGGRWTNYLTTTRERTAELVDVVVRRHARRASAVGAAGRLGSRCRRQAARSDLLLAHQPARDTSCCSACAPSVPTERLALIRAYVGERENRRHKPGRAFERVDYRFDVLSDYGAFRDLQRHRLLTIEWQPLTPNHGYVRPDLIDEAGMTEVFDDAMARSAALYDLLKDEYPHQASYAVSMAYRLRYSMQFNAREAIHMLELRSSPQGHPAYRQVALEMHRLIGEQAGHRAIAEAMNHMTMEAPELERLDAERRAEAPPRPVLSVVAPAL